MEKRSLEEFVEELLERGRTVKQICAVALATRWKPDVQAVRTHAEKVKKFFEISEKVDDPPK